MRERRVGAVAGILAAALLYGLGQLPWGWVVAAAISGAVGWGMGAQIRRLRRLSEHDPLTGISNRRPFERYLEQEWNRAVRYGRPLSLIFFEVDDFGAVNKQYGHLMGDEALKMVSREMRRSIRGTDLIARWGGDEFVLLLPETEPSQAFRLADRIRSKVEECRILDGAAAISVTVSVGVASCPGSARRPDELLRQAIEGQRRAKVHKNAVRVVS